MSELAHLVGTVPPAAKPVKHVPEKPELMTKVLVRYEPGRMPEVLPELPGEDWHSQYLRSALRDGRFRAI
jgi:hypothetical protein